MSARAVGERQQVTSDVRVLVDRVEARTIVNREREERMKEGAVSMQEVHVQMQDEINLLPCDSSRLQLKHDEIGELLDEALEEYIK